MKKLMNQAIFTRLLVGSDGKVTAEFAEPFAMLVEPIKDELAQLNSTVDNEEVHEHLLMDFAPTAYQIFLVLVGVRTFWCG